MRAIRVLAATAVLAVAGCTGSGARSAPTPPTSSPSASANSSVPGVRSVLVGALRLDVPAGWKIGDNADVSHVCVEPAGANEQP